MLWVFLEWRSRNIQAVQLVVIYSIASFGVTRVAYEIVVAGRPDHVFAKSSWVLDGRVIGRSGHWTLGCGHDQQPYRGTALNDGRASRGGMSRSSTGACGRRAVCKYASQMKYRSLHACKKTGDKWVKVIIRQ